MDLEGFEELHNQPMAVKGSRPTCDFVREAYGRAELRRVEASSAPEGPSIYGSWQDSNSGGPSRSQAFTSGDLSLPPCLFSCRNFFDCSTPFAAGYPSHKNPSANAEVSIIYYIAFNTLDITKYAHGPTSPTFIAESRRLNYYRMCLEAIVEPPPAFRKPASPA